MRARGGFSLSVTLIVSILTAGCSLLAPQAVVLEPVTKNLLNMKADFYRLHDRLRLIGGNHRPDFNQFILAAQSFF